MAPGCVSPNTPVNDHPAASRIICLDQNKWIELARAAKRPTEFPEQYKILQLLKSNVEAGKWLVPVTSTNIYETYKINNQSRRTDLALLLAFLSEGLVFRGRYRRLQEELFDILCSEYELAPRSRAPFWFLSELFWEAFSESDDERVAPGPSERVVEFVRSRPSLALFHYLTEASDEARTSATKQFSAGSDDLRKRVEARRKFNSKNSIPERRKIYRVHQLSNEIEALSDCADKWGVHWLSMSDVGPKLARRIMNEMPIYYIERELVLRLESMARPTTENDFRDVQMFCAAIPYASDVIAETLLVNVARQAKLDRKYNTRISADIRSLLD